MHSVMYVVYVYITVVYRPSWSMALTLTAVPEDVQLIFSQVLAYCSKIPCILATHPNRVECHQCIHSRHNATLNVILKCNVRQTYIILVLQYLHVGWWNQLMLAWKEITTYLFTVKLKVFRLQ